jgi:sn-glycerol 3-phosphate transport system substrate-binding protein
MVRTTFTAGLAALAVSLTSSVAFAQTEITWWHAMGGELGTKLEEIVAGYNASQSDYKVTPVYKGTYDETLTGAIAAFRAGQQPDIVQIYEVGTGTMMAAQGAIYPVYQLMADMGADFDPSAFLPAVVGYYTDTEGNMLSMPFNSSTPILYYNREIFEEAGLDPDQPPETLGEMAERPHVSKASASTNARLPADPRRGAGHIDLYRGPRPLRGQVPAQRA